MCGFLGAVLVNSSIDAALGYGTSEIGPRWRQRMPAAISRWQTLLAKWSVALVTVPILTGILLLVAVGLLHMNAPMLANSCFSHHSRALRIAAGTLACHSPVRCFWRTRTTAHDAPVRVPCHGILGRHHPGAGTAVLLPLHRQLRAAPASARRVAGDPLLQRAGRRRTHPGPRVHHGQARLLGHRGDRSDQGGTTAGAWIASSPMCSSSCNGPLTLIPRAHRTRPHAAIAATVTPARCRESAVRLSTWP